MKKKDFTKFTKRNVHKRRSKDAAKKELMRAVRESGVGYEGFKFRDAFDAGRGARVSQKPRSDERLERGIFSSSRSGFGFVSIEGVEEDIFIPEDRTRGAVDGDFVEIIYHTFRNRSGEEKTEGRVTKIIEYGRKTIIGTVKSERVREGKRRYRVMHLLPDDPRILLRPCIKELSGAREGDKVEARIIRDKSSRPSCEVIRIFGSAETKEANYAAILADEEITVDFTPEQLQEAEEMARLPLDGESRVRRDKEIIFTIDGEGAKDLDDAVSLRRLPGGGYRLGVHIADVSHYVRERTPLDRAATARGTSVYFTDKVVPMLPAALSNGACSLNAGEDKFALSAIIDLDAAGQILGVKLEESVIRSRLRGVYSEVNALFAGNATADIKKKYSAVMPALLKMRELYEILKEKNTRRGYIDFDAPEAVIELGADGYPIGIEKRERGIGERMIEQFMLTANEAVAAFLYERRIPCVYRIHEAPAPDKLSEFVNYAHNLGFDTMVITKGAPSAKAFSSLLSAAEKRGLLAPVSYTMLRSMAKARYSEIKGAHFGLGMDTYCHFTSPIRRLSDLATHRIIKKVLFEGKRAENYASYARRAAIAATEAELRAMSAERRIENLYKVIYMSDMVGECFEAVVSSVTPFGLFCELSNTCEGLVPISEMAGVFTYEEKSLSLRSRDVTYRLADKVTVTLEEADIIRGKLRFSIVEEVDF